MYGKEGKTMFVILKNKRINLGAALHYAVANKHGRIVLIFRFHGDEESSIRSFPESFVNLAEAEQALKDAEDDFILGAKYFSIDAWGKENDSDKR